MTALAYWRPPRFPGIDGNEALWNAVLTHAGSDIRLESGAGVVFEPGAAPDDTALCTCLRLRERGSETPLTLHVVWRLFPFAALFQADIGADDLPALPPALRDALVQGMADTVAAAIWPDEAAAGGRHAPRVSVLRTAALGELAPGLPADICWFDVGIDAGGGESIAIAAGVSRTALLADAAARGVLPARVFDVARTLIPVTAAHTIGSATFSADDLSHMAEGTVILMPRTPDNRRMLRVDKTILEFHARDGAWILAGRRRQTPRRDRHPLRERDVTDQTPTHDPGDPEDGGHITGALPQGGQPRPTAGADLPPPDPVSPDPVSIVGDGQDDGNGLVPKGIRLADLGLTVDFDIGEKDFTLAEIETWQPGAVVAIDPPPLEGRVEVTLRVNGRAIATGDLIAIDDRLAVRLSRLLLRG